ncbi:MAG: glycosyltransferase [Myxococcales bacterium]|nr:glycosyltransferase [Myxococcales bacterium]
MVRPRVTLVVPCYDEERRLRPEAFLEALEAHPRLDLCFVDDGSRDGTRQVLEALRARASDRIRVLALEQNGGKAEAVRQGVLASIAAGDSLVGYWDADLATPFSELPAFIEVLDREPDVDVVLGSRVKLLGREVERRFHRHVYGRAFATVVSLMLGLPVYDTQCGAKVLRSTPTLRAAFEARFQSRWIFDVELLMRLVGAWQGEGLEPARKVVEVPLRVWTDVPGSKVGVRDAIRAGVELAELGRRYGAPLRAARRS